MKAGANYTLHDSDGHKIQVQLLSKAFFVQSPLVDQLMIRPVAWSKFGSVSDAWEEAVRRAGGWSI